MSVGSFGQYRPSLWAMSARQECSSCRSRDIGWFLSASLPWEVAVGDRLRAFELLTFVGHRADAWVCAACGDFGVFDGGGYVV